MIKDELNIKILTYALALENSKYYIGKTWNLNIRFAQHISGQGAGWTRIHKPIEIMEVRSGDHEKELCLEYMREYGWENVRGAGWTKKTISKPKEIKSCELENGRPPNICSTRDHRQSDRSNNVGENEK